jgi:hypothetical protein
LATLTVTPAASSAGRVRSIASSSVVSVAAAGAGVQVQEEELDLQLPGRQGGGRRRHAGSPVVGSLSLIQTRLTRDGRNPPGRVVLVAAFKGLRECSAWCDTASMRNVHPSRVGLVSKGKHERFPARTRGMPRPEVFHARANPLATEETP